MSSKLELLSRATGIVAANFDGPHCVDAAALLLEVGACLGYTLEARPVSMFATNLTPTGSHVTGPVGLAFGENYLSSRGIRVRLMGEFEGGSPFQRNAGHMIVVSPEDELLMDPTFAQFNQLGESAAPLFVQKAPLKAGRFWEAGDGEFYVRYFAADDFMELDFEAQRSASASHAQKIADYLTT